MGNLEYYLLFGVITMKDEIVFAMYKDKAIGRKDIFRNQVRMFNTQINVDELFLKIVNYQIEKYGTQLLKKTFDKGKKVRMVK